ncbi:MAG: hypothetical protein KJ583_07570 [Nanoarchaeota archaeon]|nr:hypothetical protein [Nanoarchaeota archaeon]MBU1269838.1 hypothetical protein [Nanoarchaeota archaeon]MBU1605146.1 hypothetical protein [Nanoarchaeota archaeon]MBU2442961.1 hypothetical protein [Nanoarchaeota archaeon]
MKKFLKKYTSYPRSELLIITLFTFIIFLVLEDITRTYNLFYYFPPIDIPLHLLSGVATTIGFFWLLSFSKRRNKKTFAFIYTCIVAILWEIIETVQELFIQNIDYLKDFFFWDGFFDIVFMIVGGVIGIIILKLLKEKTDMFNDIKI